ncbi:hypothetical protein [Methylobacterium sp. 1973]|uniref:hypothetical protein n=1 Tax=Methylobacterium sp. 1973 TaxID=3156421 RepID=UPI003391FDC3
MVDLVPVDFDPFAGQGQQASAGTKLIPVDHDPFADEPSLAAKAGAVAKDMARSAEAGVDAGVAGLVGAPNALLALGDKLLSYPAKAIVRATGFTPASDLPGGDTRPSIADGFVSPATVAKSMEAATGPAYKPETTAGEWAHTVGEFAPNAAMGGGTLAQRVGQVVVPALASEGVGRAVRTIAPELEGPARLIGALAGGVGAAVAQAPRGASAVMRDGLEGISPEHLERAQAVMQAARDLPGGGVPLSLDEALNQVTGGQATRASQLAHTVATGGGEGQRIATEFYAARPGQVDAAGRAAFQGMADAPAAPSALGASVQDAARTAVAETPQGMALAEARQAAGPRVTPEQAGNVIQPALREAFDRREGMRAALAEQDYRAAERAPESVGIERTVPVERPGEPIITQQQYSRPQFTDQAPAPLGPPPGRGDGTPAEAGPESLARFVARNGGLRLDGDVAATDLHRFNIPGVGNVARQNGKGIDDFWRERLIEEGYFRPDADGGMARDISSELLRKLQNEQRGAPSYPLGSQRQVAGPTSGQLGDEYAAALSHAETRLDADLGKAGIDPKSIHPDIRSRALGAMMRGETAEPLDALERTIGALREPPAPFVKSTTVQEQIPDVRFGQANPQPVLDHIEEAMRSAKGPAAVALQQARRTLYEPDGKTLDLTVAGLHGARQAMSDLIDKAPAQTQRMLLGVRDRLDRTLSAVPEYEAARSGFEAASRNLDPFASGSAPGRIVAQDQTSGRFSMPAEQVPGAIAEGPSAARDFASVASPEARRAFEGQLTTRLLDGATDATTGVLDGGKLRGALRQHADLLDQVPAVRDRIAGIATAREGMAAVERSPLGHLAEGHPDLKRAIGVLFDRDPLAGGEREIGAAMGALAKADPQSARQLARIHLETVFNDAVAEKRGLPAQYGGAGFASAVAGNPQQAKNLEASIRALPDGDVLWGSLDRFLTTLKATGYKPQAGGDATFNARVGEQLSGGKGVGPAIAGVLANAAAGAGAAGMGGALAGGVLGAKKAAADAFSRYQAARNGEAVARMLFDPKALPDLRALAKSAPGSKNALGFTHRLLALSGSAAAPRERR